MFATTFYTIISINIITKQTITLTLCLLCLYYDYHSISAIPQKYIKIKALEIFFVDLLKLEVSPSQIL